MPHSHPVRTVSLSNSLSWTLQISHGSEIKWYLSSCVQRISLDTMCSRMIHVLQDDPCHEWQDFFHFTAEYYSNVYRWNLDWNSGFCQTLATVENAAMDIRLQRWLRDTEIIFFGFYFFLKSKHIKSPREKNFHYREKICLILSSFGKCMCKGAQSETPSLAVGMFYASFSRPF